jgi:histidinol-phosphate phosphatase family protein
MANTLLGAKRKNMTRMTREKNRCDPKNAAVFLDRDGTIIHDRGYLKAPSEVRFFTQAFPALRQLQSHVELFIVTNQLGIAEGVLQPRAVDRVNQHIVSMLADQGIHIRDTYVCPHGREDNCSCRKPKPYFLEQAAQRYGLDLEASFTIGDHPCDIQLAHNVGARGVYVLTGHGQKHRHELPVDTDIAVDIFQAAEKILDLLAALCNSRQA